MKCPSCGFEQAEGRLDCEYCGLIFTKWKERHSPSPETIVPSSPATEAKGDLPTAASTPAGKTENSETQKEADISDVPPEDVLEKASRHRLYDCIAALDFQKTTAGEWIYFPWGFFGKGYRVQNPEMKREIELFVAMFCCVHSPMVVLLAVAVALNRTYQSENTFPGWILLVLYLGAAYFFLWWRTRKWTSRLSPSTHPMNQKYYSAQFYKVFNLWSFLDLEILGLFLTLTCLWLWLSDAWDLFFKDYSPSYLVGAAAFSTALLVGFSYLHYFRKK